MRPFNFQSKVTRKNLEGIDRSWGTPIRIYLQIDFIGEKSIYQEGVFHTFTEAKKYLNKCEDLIVIYMAKAGRVFLDGHYKYHREYGAGKAKRSYSGSDQFIEFKLNIKNK